MCQWYKKKYEEIIEMIQGGCERYGMDEWMEWMNGMNGEIVLRRDATIFFLFVLNLWWSISFQVVLVDWELLYVGGKPRS